MAKWLLTRNNMHTGTNTNTFTHSYYILLLLLLFFACSTESSTTTHTTQQDTTEKKNNEICLSSYQSIRSIYAQLKFTPFGCFRISQQQAKWRCFVVLSNRSIIHLFNLIFCFSNFTFASFGWYSFLWRRLTFFLL